MFSYSALFDSVDWNDLVPVARESFDQIGTRDFEVSIEALQRASSIIQSNSIQEACACIDDVSLTLDEAASGIKDALATVIASRHPDMPSAVKDKEYEFCRQFLGHFDAYYTLNYDLLLYWSLMKTEIEPEIQHDDGFRMPDTGPEDYVVWNSTSSHTQNVYYLHGACHLFDARTELQKYTWINTGIRIIEQVREELDRNHYPLVITEGSSDQKLARILHSAYLHKGYKSLASIGNPLFVYGWSMAENDEHILRAIRRSKTKKIAVSVYGDIGEEWNQILVERCDQLMREMESRRVGAPDLVFYSAETARVWRD